MPTTVELHHRVPDLPRSEHAFERRNPADPHDVVFIAPRGTVTDVDAAVDAAATSFKHWSRIGPVARGRYLLDAAGLLERDSETVARDLTREEGKLLSEARAEVSRTVDILRFFGSLGWYADGQVFPSSDPNARIRTAREPLGVVALLTPWNFPLAIPAWKLAPALVAGCTVVLKPAELTALSVHHLARVLAEAGLPAGVLTTVLGAGSLVGNALVEHPGISGVSFTGSNAVGTDIARACHARGARVQLEMGGKNALVVSATASPAAAALIAARGAFGLTGQACTATSRVIMLPGSEGFRSAFLSEAKRFTPGNGLDPQAGMGPIVSDEQTRSVLGLIDDALSHGHDLILGDRTGAGTGMVPAHVFDNVGVTDPIAQEEVFGPVVALIRVRDLDEAIDTVNGTRFGLAAGIVTADIGEAHAFSAGAHAGIVKVNEPTTGSAVNVPFGGVGASSTNTFREQGYAALDFYTWTKTVYEAAPGWK